MSNAISHHDAPPNSTPAPAQSSGIGQKLLIGALILAAAALLGYQLLGCASCYAPI